MSDILRVTTPIIPNNAPVTPNANAEAANMFNILDPTRVIRTHNQSELLQQNNTFLGGEAPTVLMSLLKDPAVAISYLRSIDTMEEIFKLLPANNRTVTQEIEQMFHALLLPSDEVAKELFAQESESTIFKGALFDFLRNVSAENSGRANVQVSIANLLKAINAYSNKGDIMDAVANSLEYLGETVSASKQLSAKINTLVEAFRQKGAEDSFPALKGEVLGLAKSLSESILMSPKMSKILSITIYNLSRYNESDEFLGESVFRLRQFLSEPDQKTFTNLIKDYIAKLATGTREGAEHSKVMDNLTGLIMESAKSEKGSTSAEKTDAILHSLLSSPCNFTPLLHYIVPMSYEGQNAFSEIWINPEGESGDTAPDGTKGTHILMVIDVEGAGKFEAEFFVHKNIIDFALFCPNGLEDKYAELKDTIPRIIAKTEFKTGAVRVEPLARPRSLMEVFRTLPYKRVGVDVKV